MSLKECASSQLPKGENLTKNRGQIFFSTKSLSPSSALKSFDLLKISIKYKTVENNYEIEKEMINRTNPLEIFVCLIIERMLSLEDG